MVAYNCQKDAALPEEKFDPRTGLVNRVDSGMKRWWARIQEANAHEHLGLSVLPCSAGNSNIGPLGLHWCYGDGT